MMGWGIAAVQRRQIRSIATGIIGLGLSATTILPSAIGADSDQPESSREEASASYASDKITTQISGIRTLLLNQTSALQKQTSDIAAALQKQSSDIAAALQKTSALETRIDGELRRTNETVSRMRSDLDEHIRTHKPSVIVTPPAEPKPPIVKKVVHIHRHYYPCCEPCW